MAGDLRPFSDGVFQHQILDVTDRLGRIEPLGTGLHAVHDGVAAVGAALVVPAGQALLAGLVARVHLEPVGRVVRRHGQATEVLAGLGRQRRGGGRTGGTAGNGGTVTVTATDPSQANYLTTGTQTWTSLAGWSFQIGGRQVSLTDWLDGTISECIALDRNATTLERQKIEGYLAHKWGLVTSLPSDHPFKNYAPTVG